MSILCRCNSCNTRFRVKDSLAGKKGRCAKCGAVFRIPVPQPTPEVSEQDLPPPIDEPPIEVEIVLAEAIESLPLPPTNPPVPSADVVTRSSNDSQPVASPGSAPVAHDAPMAKPLSAMDLPLARPLESAVPQATPIQPGVPHTAPLGSGQSGGIHISTEPRVRRRKKTGLSTALVTMVFLASCLILIAALFFLPSIPRSKNGDPARQHPNQSARGLRRECRRQAAKSQLDASTA